MIQDGGAAHLQRHMDIGENVEEDLREKLCALRLLRRAAHQALVSPEENASAKYLILANQLFHPSSHPMSAP